MSELRTEILISGGGVGECAAALAAELGRFVILTEESDWIGRQLASQAVAPDENGWIERFGGAASYRRYRDQVRDFYHRHYPMTDQAQGRARRENLKITSGY